MRKEPVVTVASITALVAAGLTLAAAFGLHLSKEETTAIMGAVAVLAPIVAGLIGRQFVTPTAKVVPVGVRVSNVQAKHPEALLPAVKKAAHRGKDGRFK